MTIILFIVDTSASMAQKSYQGISTLDLAKSLVDALLKQRARDVAARGFDRYMLMTTEDFPNCIKTGWREGNTVLNEQLKALRPRGRNSLANTILNAFKFINLNRAQSGIDNYGCGRFPHFLEPVVIVAITDGTAAADVPKDHQLQFSGKPSLGSELTKEAFRWDQRLHTVVLRLPSQPQRFIPGARIESDLEHIDRLCSSTGGRSFCLTSHKQIGQCVEQIVQSVQVSGICVRFECPALNGLRDIPTLNGDNSQSGEDASKIRLKRKMEMKPVTLVILRALGGRPLVGHWPIPEAFWHDRIENGCLPSRFAHPAVVFHIEPNPSQVQSDFPFDKYEVEPSPVVDYVLERFHPANPNLCFQVFVYNSGRVEGYGKPFGYLKAASSGQSVNLFIMPYNYPVLMQLLEEFKADPRVRNGGPSQWRQRLDRYLESVPPYYLSPLRRALSKHKIGGGLLDEQSSGSHLYSPSIRSYLSNIKKQGKEEYEKTCTTVSVLLQQTVPGQTSYVVPVERRSNPSRSHFRSEVENSRKEERARDKEKRNPRGLEKDDEVYKDPAEGIGDGLSERTQVQLHIGEARIRPLLGSKYRNPFIIRKEELAEQLPKMRMNISIILRGSTIPVLEGGPPGLSLKLHNAEELHSLPVSQMGNYEEYIKGLEAIGKGPLREVEPAPVRAHAFGNPFKTDKKSMAIDEVGEGPVGAVSSPSKETRRERKGSHASDGRPPKRKPGPLSSNCMQQLRERRHSISERSSVVSDLSYTTDLDEEIASTSDTPPTGQNGFLKTDINGDEIIISHNRMSIDDGMYGLDEEAEESSEDDSPPIKKPRAPQPVPPDELSNDELTRRKIRIAAAVRRPASGKTVWDELNHETKTCPVRDQLMLMEFAIRDSRRFKRKALTDQLDKEVVRLRKLLTLS